MTHATTPTGLTRYEEMIAGLLAAFAADCACWDRECADCREAAEELLADCACQEHEGTCAACIAEDTLYVLGGSSQTTDKHRARAREMALRWDTQNIRVG